MCFLFRSINEQVTFIPTVDKAFQVFFPMQRGTTQLVRLPKHDVRVPEAGGACRAPVPCQEKWQHISKRVKVPLNIQKKVTEASLVFLTKLLTATKAT